jgi:hypothetical protein
MPKEGALHGKVVKRIVETADMKDQEILEAVRKAGASCVKWGGALQSLFVGNILDCIYFRNEPGKTIQPQDWDRLEHELRAGKAAFLHVNMPGSTDHVFTIVGDDKDAYVLHPCSDNHGLRAEPPIWAEPPIRAEPPMRIEKMIDLLEKLTQYEYTTFCNIAKIRRVREQLWGADHMGPTESLYGAIGRKKISFSLIASGEPKKSLTENKEVLWKLTQELAEWQSESSVWSSATSYQELHSVNSSVSKEAFDSEITGKVRFVKGFVAALGFVLGASRVLYNEALEPKVSAGVAEDAGQIFKGSILCSNVIAGT